MMTADIRSQRLTRRAVLGLGLMVLAGPAWAHARDVDAAYDRLLGRYVGASPDGVNRVEFIADLGGNDAGLIAHFRRYAEPALAQRLAGSRRIADDDYGWSLNGLRPVPAPRG
jgi:hypothetical protein